MDATEPTYVATTIFQDRQSYEQWAATTTTNPSKMSLQRTPEKVYYEGTLVISSGTYYIQFPYSSHNIIQHHISSYSDCTFSSTATGA
jgi:hypothetical protein